jgi:hypothetical protein
MPPGNLHPSVKGRAAGQIVEGVGTLRDGGALGGGEVFKFTAVATSGGHWGNSPFGSEAPTGIDAMLACTVQAKPEIIEMFFAVVQHISAKSPFCEYAAARPIRDVTVLGCQDENRHRHLVAAATVDHPHPAQPLPWRTTNTSRCSGRAWTPGTSGVRQTPTSVRTSPRRTSAGRTSAGRTSPRRTSARRTSAGRTSAGRTSPRRTSAGRTSAGRTSARRTSTGRTSAGRTSAGQTSPGLDVLGNGSLFRKFLQKYEHILARLE